MQTETKQHLNTIIIALNAERTTRSMEKAQARASFYGLPENVMNERLARWQAEIDKVDAALSFIRSAF